MVPEEAGALMSACVAVALRTCNRARCSGAVNRLPSYGLGLKLRHDKRLNSGVGVASKCCDLK